LQLPSPALVSAPEQQQIQPNQIINNPLALSSNTNNVNGLNVMRECLFQKALNDSLNINS
jgi:hypothetical protein